MSTPDTWDQMIQAYLEGELAEAERVEVERLIQTDAAFRTQLAQYEQAYRRVAAVAQAEHRKAFDAQFRYEAPTPISRPLAPFFFRAAAILLPLVLLAAAWYGLRQHYHAAGWIAMDTIVSDYQAPQNRSGNADSQTRLEQATYAFQTRSYETAISLSQAVPAADIPNYYEALTLQGLSYLYMNEPEKAVEVLERLNQQLESQTALQPYAPPTHWYLAISYLRTGQWEQARIHLDWLMEKNSFNKYKQTEAAEWLQRMGSFWFPWFN